MLCKSFSSYLNKYVSFNWNIFSFLSLSLPHKLFLFSSSLSEYSQSINSSGSFSFILFLISSFNLEMLAIPIIGEYFFVSTGTTDNFSLKFIHFSFKSLLLLLLRSHKEEFFVVELVRLFSWLIGDNFFFVNLYDFLNNDLLFSIELSFCWDILKYGKLLEDNSFFFANINSRLLILLARFFISFFSIFILAIDFWILSFFK